MMTKFIPASLLALIITVVCLPLQADSPAAQITVSGLGKVTVQPDMATVQFSFTSRSKESHQAKSIIDTQVINLLKLCNKLGIKKKEIQAANLSIYPEYEYKGPGKLIGYRVSRNVRVTVRNMGHYSDLLDGAAGIGASHSGSPFLDFSNRDELENEATLKAFRQARQKAQLLAQEAGGNLGAVISISEAGTHPAPNPPLKQRAMAMEAKAVPYPSGEVEITRQIFVSFGFEI